MTRRLSENWTTMTSRPNTTIERLPMNWSLFETGDETSDARYSELWVEMFCEWCDWHYGWANLSLCGDELIGSIDYANHPFLPESLYESFAAWVGGEAFERVSAYDAMDAGSDLADLFGPTA
jgi:hypothetical protein